ncbi:MAG TPA: M14 family zinc carboxypeptidase, partial [Candidatus Glassbacteria bacterium]|nr:M14 family zinc carboxypeptidase [Candidatus Glassbacteria bacterium]
MLKPVLLIGLSVTLFAVEVKSLGAAEKFISARFTIDRTRVRVGEEVKFDASASVAGEDSELFAYLWDFDGTDQVNVDARGPQMTHVFNHTGAYTVRLMVENDIGERDQAVGFVEVLPEVTDGLSITDHFEGGKSGVFLKSDCDFCFRLEWGGQFYFRLDNCRNRPVSLKIIGYGPNRLQIPAVTPYADDYSFDEKFALMANTDYQNPDWQPLTQVRYSYDDSSATLVAKFTPTSESIYLAWAAPYEIGRLEKFIDAWENNPRFSWSTIGLSVEGRPLYYISVTDPKEDDQKKKAVWITGNQHGYEMAAEYVCEGIVAALLEDSDSARTVLKNTVYNMVPMVNPDAVMRGGYRYNMGLVDLNRNWDDVAINEWDNKLPQPEVASIKRAIGDWVSGGGRLDFFFDFHCLTTIAENLLMIRAAPDSMPENVAEAQQRFTDLFAKKYVWRRSEDQGLQGSACTWAAKTFAAET